MNKSSDIASTAPGKGKALLNQIAADASDMYGGTPATRIETGIEAPLRFGMTLAFLVFGVFGLWSVLAPIEGAAHAPGFITPRSYKTPVQHLEGGIVKEVLVVNGDEVEADEVLLIMDATRPQADLEILTGQMLSLRAAEARLLAERDGLATVAWPQELSAAGALGQAEMTAQSQIFDAHKIARDGAVAVLNQRISQLETRLGGLRAQRESKLQLAASFEEDLESVKSLLAEGFESRGRLRELERSSASMTADAAELAAQIAATEISAGETRLEIQQQENTFQSDVANELSQVQNQLKDVRERVTALSDVVARTEVRAPQAGIVNGLRVHTADTVIPAGEVIAEIVPQNDVFVIDAMVSVADRDRVHEGQEATIRLPTFNSRTTPTFYGHVINVAADSVQQQNGVAYYQARIAVDEESRAELESLALTAGMPAEVLISTGSRTFMQFLTKPLTDSWALSFRDD